MFQATLILTDQLNNTTDHEANQKQSVPIFSLEIVKHSIDHNDNEDDDQLKNDDHHNEFNVMMSNLFRIKYYYYCYLDIQ
ncbi:hypothetical protein DERF_014964 [Dermatophagoides farinae]|uniref:Uncharacterized protein n=1 Tax=Dermatophagoides farinae TaxID=6954 RepID=A0A922HKF7_DERFA|nr:hypothetical protein DERF_014964 [Dermatophagoides farinae]